MEKFRLDEQWYRFDEDFFSADELYFRSDVKKFDLDILTLLKDLYWFTSDDDFLNPDMEWYSLDADEDDLAFAWFRADAGGDRGALQAPAAAGARSRPDEKTPSDSSPVYSSSPPAQSPSRERIHSIFQSDSRIWSLISVGIGFGHDRLGGVTSRSE
jgi:hypothetical protein